jgi:broad specificity phosphatase PhoE
MATAAREGVPATSLAPASLRRLLLVRAASSVEHDAGRLAGALDPPLSARGRAQAAERRRHWEWADVAWSSPFRRAWETAEILAGAGAFRMEAAFAPPSLGAWEGRTLAELERTEPIAAADFAAGLSAAPSGEPRESLRERVRAGLLRVLASEPVSPLIVAHGEVIREIVRLLTRETLAPGRPLPAELVLMTRGPDGELRLGRRSSDPEPLRSALERTGLSGDDGGFERHIGELWVRDREL